MNKYDVTLTAHYEKTVSVYADTPEQAKEMYLAAEKNHVKTMVAFNYRKTPAIQLAKKYIDEGAIGDILDFRGTYLQDWSADPDSPLSWRFQKDIAGAPRPQLFPPQERH